MAIIGALMGIGVGAFAHLGRSDKQASGQVKDALRAARLYALRASAPASVVVDPGAGEVFATGLVSAGTWHFEDDAGTGWPAPARHAPGALLPDGVIGSAVSIAGDDVLLVTDLPGRFDSPHGFGLDVFVRPEAEPRPMTILERPGRWAVRLDEDDRLEVLLRLVATPEPEEFVVSTGGRLPPDRFTQLGVLFDGRVLHVALDGRRLGEDTVLEHPRTLAPAAGSVLRSGDGVRRFRGALDELSISAVVEGEHRPLPAEVALEGALRVLRLDEYGHLDPAWHRTAQQVSFRTGEPPQRTVIELGTLGTVRSWTDAP
jgi:hypothetical protein